jgi:hypothetical protein
MQSFRITNYAQILHIVDTTKKTEIYVNLIIRFTIETLQFKSYYLLLSDITITLSRLVTNFKAKQLINRLPVTSNGKRFFFKTFRPDLDPSHLLIQYVLKNVLAHQREQITGLGKAAI